ncbi:outer membrane beta-barrel protein [Bdellovibrio sp. ZAP7]|uniref:outer membrane beta-barrel protein n=1 Tax=Bdellovibrio sp. ZAP7 TaxID=2231053 RepID=UPI001FEE28FA|nr:outer membrane beta-barrel protein [Bdellovibrio sp. ZAP7]
MRIFKLLAFMTLAASFANAADIGGITVNGEIAFDYNFLDVNSLPFSGSASNETYRINTSQILAKKETEQFYVLARLVYTPTTYVTATTPAEVKSTSNLGMLDQVEVYYKPLPNLYIGAGRFLTTMGYESVLRSENLFYGYSIAFQGITPGYGEGLRARYVMSDLLTATVSTYNQSKYNMYGDDYTPTKTTELSANGAFGDLQWFAAYYFGKDAALSPTTGTAENTSSNVWASYRINDSWMIAAMYDSKTYKPDNDVAGWSDDLGVVVNYKLWNNSFAARYEMVRGAMHLREFDTLVYGSADKVNSLTLNDKIELNPNLNVYLEYRADHADEKCFTDTDGNSTENAQLLTLGVLAKF